MRNPWELYESDRDFAAATAALDAAWEQAKRLSPEAPATVRAYAADAKAEGREVVS